MSRSVSLLLLLAACAPRTDQPYPDGFVWGASTSGFQVEMGCPTWSDARCLDTRSDWYQWVTTPRITGDPDLDVTGEDWGSAPAGIVQVTDEASSYGLPVVITENGTADVANAPRLLREHLQYLQRAIAGGDDVRGYYYWSWVDNYEWSHGMAVKFGLNALDVGTKQRIPRPVLDVYEQAIRANGPTAD